MPSNLIKVVLCYFLEIYQHTGRNAHLKVNVFLEEYKTHSKSLLCFENCPTKAVVVLACLVKYVYF